MKLALHALFLTVLILVVNLNLPTQLSQDEDTWQSRMELHEQSQPYSLRPMTCAVTRIISDNLGLSLREAFVAGQYPLLFALLLSFASLLRKLGMCGNRPLVGMWVLAFSFPIFCLHFIPNYTIDDLWAYLGLVWMTWFLVSGRFAAASACLVFAVLSRENTLIAIPAFWVFRDRGVSRKTVLFAALAPVVLYLVYRLALHPAISPGRFAQLEKNFADPGNLRQTFHSLFVSFGWLWYPAVSGVRRVFKEKAGQPLRGLAASTAMIGVVCVGLTLVAALARETRLFFTPFAFLIPLALLEMERLMPLIRRAGGRGWGVLFLLMILSVLVSIVLFPSFVFLPMVDFHRVFFALNLALLGTIWLLSSDRVGRLVAGWRRS